MKILYVAYASSPYGGSEEALGWSLPLAMSRIKGNQVYLLTKVEQRIDIERYFSQNPETNIKVIYCDIPRVFKRLFKGYLYPGRHGIWLKNATKIIQLLDSDVHFDVIHQIAPVEFRSICQLDKITSLKVVGPQGGAEYAPSGLSRYLKSVALFEIFRRFSNWVIAHSPSFRKAFNGYDIHLFANYETKAYLVSNGITTANEGLIKTEIGCWGSSWFERSETKHEIPHILFVGRLIPRKGVELLIDACKELEELCDFELRIVGEGHLYNRLKQKISDYKLNNISLVGQIPYTKIADEYKWADFFVMPSVRETSGTVLVESLQYGIPLIAFNQDGARVALDESVCSYVPASRGAHGFAEAMANWILHPELMPSKREIRKSFDNLTWEKRAEYYYSLYQKNAKCSDR